MSPTMSPTAHPTVRHSNAVGSTDSTDSAGGAADTLELLRLFRRCAHLQRPVERTGQNRILITLREHGGMTQRKLAEATQRSAATLSQQLEAMEQEGLVVRRPNAEDRRTVDVALTPQGETAAQGALDERRRTADELFGGLSASDRAALARILGTLERSWRDRADARRVEAPHAALAPDGTAPAGGTATARSTALAGATGTAGDAGAGAAGEGGRL